MKILFMKYICLHIEAWQRNKNIRTITQHIWFIWPQFYILADIKLRWETSINRFTQKLYFINITPSYFTFMYSFDRNFFIIYIVQTDFFFLGESGTDKKYSIIHTMKVSTKKWFLHRNNVSQYDSQCSLKCHEKE